MGVGRAVHQLHLQVDFATLPGISSLRHPSSAPSDAKIEAMPSCSHLLPITLLLGSLLVTLDGSAASLTKPKHQDVLFVEGEFEKGDFEVFMHGVRKLQKLPYLARISSRGGDVETAMRFGRFFRRAGIKVIIPADGECASACFLVLAGAPERVILSSLRRQPCKSSLGTPRHQ